MAQSSNTRTAWGRRINNSLSCQGNKFTQTTNYVNSIANTTTFAAAVQAANPGWPIDLSPRPYSWSKEVAMCGVGKTISWYYVNRYTSYPSWTLSWSGGIIEPSPSYGSPKMPDYSVIYNNALEKFYSKVRGESANLAVDAIEMPKTLLLLKQYSRDLMGLRKKLLGSLADPRAIARLRRQFSQFKKSKEFKKKVHIYRLDIKRVFKDTDDFAATEWLKFTLGLRPTISTFDTISKLMPKVADDVYTVTGSDTQMRRTVQGWASGGNTYGAEHDAMTSIRITGTYAVGNSQAAFLHTIVPATPASTVWELVPLSFVADYAVNIGQYLNLLDAALARGLVFRGGYSRKYDQTTTHVIGGSLSSVDSLQGSTYDTRSHLRKQSYSRTLITSFPRPCQPSIRLNLNGEKIANIGALLDQFTRRICRSLTS